MSENSFDRKKLKEEIRTEFETELRAEIEAELRKEAAKEFLNVFHEFQETQKLMEDDPDEYHRRENISDYENAKKQIAKMQTITFGSKINVLLLTDRLYGCANGLQEYLQNSTDITVDIVHKLEDAEGVVSEKPIDFLIIVGYLKNKENYKAIQAVKRLNKYACIIMYASLDYVIRGECYEHGIDREYDRYYPMSGFISYMQECYREETAKLQFQFSSKITREQVRESTIQELENAASLREQARMIEMEKNIRNKRKIFWLKLLGHSIAILFVLTLNIAFFTYGLWNVNYNNLNVSHYEYKGENYILHINEGWKDIIIDMQHDGVLTSKIVSNKGVSQHGLYKKVDPDFPLFSKRHRRDYDKIIEYMLSEEEGRGINEN